jgi:hypothetical protein
LAALTLLLARLARLSRLSRLAGLSIAAELPGLILLAAGLSSLTLARCTGPTVGASAKAGELVAQTG